MWTISRRYQLDSPHAVIVVELVGTTLGEDARICDLEALGTHMRGLWPRMDRKTTEGLLMRLWHVVVLFLASTRRPATACSRVELRVGDISAKFEPSEDPLDD